MRKLMTVIIATVGVMTFGALASAQNTNRSTTSTPNLTGTTTEAPVGHRQPRVDQVPSEKNLGNPNDPVNREDAALDRKIKSICRGC